MSLPRIVVDNSAMRPAFFPEPRSDHFDGGLVTARARSLIHAIRMRRVSAFVPPSFYREFLNVAVLQMDGQGGRGSAAIELVRAQWYELLSLPLIPVPLSEILHHSGVLTLDERCPAADAWYVATAVHSTATFWISHAHADSLAAIASRHVQVRLLANEAPDY